MVSSRIKSNCMRKKRYMKKSDSMKIIFSSKDVVLQCKKGYI